MLPRAPRGPWRIGTEAGRLALWRRLDDWRAQWDGREDDLGLVAPRIDDPVTEELGLERALREALLRGRGWITTAEDRLRVRESCVTAACREEFTPFRGGPPVRRVLVQAEESTGETVYRVEAHVFHTVGEVVDRLARYPKTVAIAWHAGSSHSPVRATALYNQVAAAGSKRGVRLLAEPPPAAPQPLRGLKASADALRDATA